LAEFVVGRVWCWSSLLLLAGRVVKIACVSNNTTDFLLGNNNPDNNPDNPDNKKKRTSFQVSRRFHPFFAVVVRVVVGLVFVVWLGCWPVCCCPVCCCCQNRSHVSNKLFFLLSGLLSRLLSRLLSGGCREEASYQVSRRFHLFLLLTGGYCVGRFVVVGLVVVVGRGCCCWSRLSKPLACLQ